MQLFVVSTSSAMVYEKFSSWNPAKYEIINSTTLIKAYNNSNDYFVCCSQITQFGIN